MDTELASRSLRKAPFVRRAPDEDHEVAYVSKILWSSLNISNSWVCASALNDVDGQPTSRRLFVFGLHVRAGLAHGSNDFIQGNEMISVTP
ncbi:hypothetical protein D3C80_1733590 [compost metagenome]